MTVLIWLYLITAFSFIGTVTTQFIKFYSTYQLLMRKSVVIRNLHNYVTVTIIESSVVVLCPILERLPKNIDIVQFLFHYLSDQITSASYTGFVFFNDHHGYRQCNTLKMFSFILILGTYHKLKFCYHRTDSNTEMIVL